VRSVVIEEAFAGTEHDRVDHQAKLIDQVALEQGLSEVGAAEDIQVATGLLLQGEHRVSDIAAQQGRVLPAERVGERSGRDVRPMLNPVQCPQVSLRRPDHDS
jgi:hypothetical protein